MNITEGFQLESPSVFIPWGIATTELESLLGESIRCVREGYYTLTCESLGGMEHELGLHMSSYTAHAHLRMLEFFRTDYSDQEASYASFQRHFEAAFGVPDFTEPGSDGFPHCVWHLGDVIINHYVYDRFGLEEHMEIFKANESPLLRGINVAKSIAVEILRCLREGNRP